MGRGSNRIYNLISLLFLVLTLLVAGLVIARMGQPPSAVPTPVAQVPTLAILPTFTQTDTFTPVPPTFTPTHTETPSVTPTFTSTVTNTWTLIPTRTFTPTVATNTPAPPTDTLSPSLTYTLTPSQTITPSLTITFTLTPSNTVPPSNTPLPSNTPNNFTPQPTEPPPSPFPFSLRDRQPPTLTLNFANSAGCAWQGIGGQVTDITGQHIGGIRVHVYGSGIDTTTTSGSNTLYGPSGWEVPLANVVSTNVYSVELLSQGGTIISETVRVQFPGNCQQNLALVNFAQTRDF